MGIMDGLSQALTPQNTFSIDPGNFANALNQAQAGQQANIANQNALGSALLAQSQGQGPNPAQLQLMNNANTLAQQQAGSIASQKGINPMLAARQIQQTGAQASQAAAGQGATLQAQQQLAAQNQLGNVYGNIGQENSAQMNMGAQGLTGMNQLNAGVSAQNAAANQGTGAGLLGGAAAAVKSLIPLAHGGMVPHFAGGGYLGGDALSGDSAYMPMDTTVDVFAQPQAPALGSSALPPSQSPAVNSLGGQDMAAQLGNLPPAAAKPDDGYTPNFGDGGASAKIAQQIMAKAGIPQWGAGTGGTGMTSGMNALGSAAGQKMFASEGAYVPGQASVAGDSLKNDKVPAMLSPGEIVLPRSVAQSGDAPDLAREFVAQLEKKKGKGGGYGAVLEAKRKAGMQ